MTLKGRVLVIAGSDPCAGAGLQADLKTIMALGGYATTVVSAITVQNTLGVFGVHPTPPDVVAGQMRAVLNDIGLDAVKIGMLGTSDIVVTVARILGKMATAVPVILDPIIRATRGTILADLNTVEAIKKEIFPHADLITPNIPEAEHLVGFEIRDLDDMKRAAEVLCSLGPEAVLVTGGHLQSEVLYDVLLGAEDLQVYESKRIASRNTHGTGCTLSSAIAVGLAQGLDLVPAIARARAFVAAAITHAPGLGGGTGPLDHAMGVPPFGVS